MHYGKTKFERRDNVKKHFRGFLTGFKFDIFNDTEKYCRSQEA